MKIGDEIYVHGCVDEIRKDCIIVKNKGGYFGTVQEEISEVIPPIDLSDYDLWIPVSEFLPMNLVLVLVTYIDEDVNYPTVDIGYHTSRGFCDRDFNVIDNVLAWKKLPKPYEVEK